MVVRLGFNGSDNGVLCWVVVVRSGGSGGDVAVIRSMVGVVRRRVDGSPKFVLHILFVFSKGSPKFVFSGGQSGFKTGDGGNGFFGRNL